MCSYITTGYYDHKLIDYLIANLFLFWGNVIVGFNGCFNILIHKSALSCLLSKSTYKYSYENSSDKNIYLVNTIICLLGIILIAQKISTDNTNIINKDILKLSI